MPGVSIFIIFQYQTIAELRKIAAILFLCILLFNTYGYKLLMHYVEQKQQLAIEQQLNNNQYDEASLIEIKVPLSVPYLSEWKEFERVDGEIEYKDVHYKYVKRKIEKGYLILKCIPNESKTRIVNAKDAFFKLVNDLQTQTPVKKSSGDNHTAKAFSFEYCQKTIAWNFSDLPLSLTFNKIDYAGSLLSAVICSPEQPPETVCINS